MLQISQNVIDHQFDVWYEETYDTPPPDNEEDREAAMTEMSKDLYPTKDGSGERPTVFY